MTFYNIMAPISLAIGIMILPAMLAFHEEDKFISKPQRYVLAVAVLNMAFCIYQLNR
jgi:hypothetical protein